MWLPSNPHALAGYVGPRSTAFTHALLSWTAHCPTTILLLRALSDTRPKTFRFQGSLGYRDRSSGAALSRNRLFHHRNLMRSLSYVLRRRNRPDEARHPL